MKVKLPLFILLLFILSLFTGCEPVGNRSISITTVYGIAAVLSLLILIGYIVWARYKNKWYLLLFSSVFIVNIGYYALSHSQSVNAALMYNRISYLGSVFLPFAMLMSTLTVTKIQYHRRLPIILLIISIMMFLITASPGYTTVYYENVELNIINGVSFLEKDYGPWHDLYLLYLLTYFASMIACIIHSIRKEKTETTTHVIILTLAVFINIGVWFMEQLIHINFEFLSISYIISELFLLSLQFVISENHRLVKLIRENENQKKEKPVQHPEATASFSVVTDSFDPDQVSCFIAGIKDLTPTEKRIYDFYIARATTREIRAILNITENTLKFHNKNIYSKLGVSSRKDMMEIYKYISSQDANLL